MNRGDDPIEVAEIVHEKPHSGEFEEVLFGSDSGNTLWVRFSDKDGANEWIGKFGCGWSNSMRVTKAVSPDRFMIVAGGCAYVIDATTRKLLNQHSGAYTQDVAYDPTRNHFIAADIRLRVIEDGREIWSSHRISIDGIHSLQVDGRVLKGRTVVGYEGEEDDFAFDLESRQFISGPDFSSWDDVPPVSKNRRWWQFWK